MYKFPTTLTSMSAAMTLQPVMRIQACRCTALWAFICHSLFCIHKYLCSIVTFLLFVIFFCYYAVSRSKRSDLVWTLRFLHYAIIYSTHTLYHTMIVQSLHLSQLSDRSFRNWSRIWTAVKSGCRTNVPRNANMEKLRNGYLFPEVVSCYFIQSC